MLNTLKLKFLLKTLLWFIPVLLLAIFCLTCKDTIKKLAYFSGARKDMVKVQGEVYYDDYNKEDILIFWRKNLLRGAPKPTSRPLVIKQVPASYNIYIPKTVKSFYICARGNVVKGKIKNNSTAYFISDLITIDPKKDKIFIDIPLKKRAMVMNNYQGRVVKISGKIVQQKYKKGFISIAVETPENHKKVFLPPDIAQKFIAGPVDYTIDVPEGVGEVYINALHYPNENYYGDMPGVLSAAYINNPVKVGSSDIYGVDIIIE